MREGGQDAESAGCAYAWWPVWWRVRRSSPADRMEAAGTGLVWEWEWLILPGVSEGIAENYKCRLDLVSNSNLLPLCDPSNP